MYVFISLFIFISKEYDIYIHIHVSPYDKVRIKTLADNLFHTSGSPRNDPYPFLSHTFIYIYVYIICIYIYIGFSLALFTKGWVYHALPACNHTGLAGTSYSIEFGDIPGSHGG